MSLYSKMNAQQLSPCVKDLKLHDPNNLSVTNHRSRLSTLIKNHPKTRLAQQKPTPKDLDGFDLSTILPAINQQIQNEIIYERREMAIDGCQAKLQQKNGKKR